MAALWAHQMAVLRADQTVLMLAGQMADQTVLMLAGQMADQTVLMLAGKMADQTVLMLAVLLAACIVTSPLLMCFQKDKRYNLHYHLN
jgi:hypothetical protein